MSFSIIAICVCIVDKVIKLALIKKKRKVGFVRMTWWKMEIISMSIVLGTRCVDYLGRNQFISV